MNNKSRMSWEVPVRFCESVRVRPLCATRLVIMAKYMTPKIKTWIEDILEHRFSLTVNQEKTKIINLAKPKSSLDFLGFTLRRVELKNLRWKQFCLITPSQKSLNKAVEKIREHTKSRNGYKPIGEVVKGLNQFLRGWGQYFRKGNPSQGFMKVNGYVQDRLYRFLQRRSQRGYKKRDRNQSWYSHFKEIGIIALTKSHRPG